MSAPRRLSACLLAIAALGSAWSADLAPESFRAATRGFGQVEVAMTAAGQGSLTVFRAEDPAHARVCASKRLGDLLGFGDLKPVADTGLAGTVVAAEGVGAWLLGVRGAEFRELFAPDLAALKAAAGAAGALEAVAPRSHPRWLDCFDQAGPGVWVGGGGDQYDLPHDFEWLHERRLAMCTLSPNESRLVGPGLLDTSIYDWHRAMAARYDLPYRLLQFPKRPAWAWNRTPLPYLQPAPGFVPHPFLEWTAGSLHSAHEPNAATDPFVHDGRRRLAERLNDDPNVVGWHGATEIPNAGILELAVVAGTPGMQQLWQSYLVGELGLDLAGVARLHTGSAGTYRSWSEVRVPLPEDFLGRARPGAIDLAGIWDTRPDAKREGRDAGWFQPGAGAAGDWTPAAHNDVLIQMYGTRYNHKKEQLPFWMRRTFTVDANRLGAARFLHLARSNWHGNYQAGFDVWVNGQQLKLTTRDERGDWDQCFDLGGAVKAGANTIVIDTHGSPIPGWAFINDQPFQAYPQMDPARNRLWFDAVNFSAWLRIRHIEDNLKAVRAADPDRPLKMMALINMLDLSTRLCEQYGAYQHDTGGAGGYWCPMTGARLARSHGLPWSCEQGGPPSTVADIQKSSTLYLMYGNDATDLVFGVRHYSGKPEIAAWVDQNLELLRCTGQMVLPPPAVGILRSTRTTRLGFREPWNWDLGRGPLQAVGRTFAYAETPDLADGRISQFPLVIDDGTVLMTDEDVAGIERYVRGGGIFVAQHHTGRHSPERADAWPISRLTGLKVVNEGRAVGGTLRFTAKQELWPTLRGRELKGWGQVLDYLNQDVAGQPVGMSAEASDVEAVAEWVGRPGEPARLAVASRRLGKGRIITLGSTFWRDARDAGGAYRESKAAQDVIDELLSSLGVARDSWTGNDRVWAERWRSKNGVFDLYPVAHMNEGDKRAPDTVEVAVGLRREQPVQHLVEISALGHPRVAVQWQDGRVVLPRTAYERMQSRVFIAPRAERARAALDWFRTQASIWRALPPVPAVRKPVAVAVPEDLLPLADGWRLAPDTAPAADAAAVPAWAAPAADDAAWKPVRLGAFGTLGLPEDAVGRFRTRVALPEAWKGRTVTLVFDAEDWFFGLMPQARLWVDGQPAALRQPLTPQPRPGFSLDVTAQAADGVIDLALEVDGTRRDAKRRQGRPHGVTGLFYLQGEPPPLRSLPLAGWQGATEFNRLAPLPADGKGGFVYQQTAFNLPADRPAGRLFLERDSHLGTIVLNGRVVETPPWMTRLDISGLVDAGGANVLRWSPALPDSRNLSKGGDPGLRLVWRP